MTILFKGQRSENFYCPFFPEGIQIKDLTQATECSVSQLALLAELDSW